MVRATRGRRERATRRLMETRREKAARGRIVRERAARRERAA